VRQSPGQVRYEIGDIFGGLAGRGVVRDRKRSRAFGGDEAVRLGGFLVVKTAQVFAANEPGLDGRRLDGPPGEQPLALGADVSVHSMTKYLSGHGDVTAGAAVFADAELAQRVRMVGLKDMTGAVMSPQDAHLVLRGIKTLALRMDRHCQNAQAVAELIAAHPEAAVVHYPGLASFPQHALAQRQMRQMGGMIAFELHGGLQAGIRFMDALRLVTRAVSLGDAESLAQHPASMTHSTYSPEERAAHGISEGLVRLSIGLEDIEDLLADVGQALDCAHALQPGSAPAPGRQSITLE